MAEWALELKCFKNEISDPMINPRVDPSVDPSSRQIAQPYILTPDRLRQIRADLLYPFYDQGNHLTWKG